MTKMIFREAQLVVLGALPEHCARNKVELNNLQVFEIGDCVQVIEISLDKPEIVIKTAECVESYCAISSFAEWVVDECIGILREVAVGYDQNLCERNWDYENR